MATIYIQSYSKDALEVALESLIILHVFEICDNDNIYIKVVFQETNLNVEPLFKVDFQRTAYSFINDSDIPCLAKYCMWPVLVVGNRVVAGLASVSRQIVKQCSEEKITALLGFRAACLMACNESSIWTKFCEVDMLHTVKHLLQNANKFINCDSILIPSDLTKFETHMGQPIRIHNVYKLARLKNNDKLIKSNIPVEDLNLDHRFGEGPFMTLSDLLLFPCFKILFIILNKNSLRKELPKTVLWYENVCVDVQGPNFNFDINFEKPVDPVYFQEKIVNESLYISDPNRYKPQNRIYTKQNDVENALSYIQTLSLDDDKYEKPFGHETEFSWLNVPMEANPLGGSLPKSRASRKCEQLENLAKAALKISKNKCHTIVDFCSGSGHLGILIATLLPNSRIILVENKERSLDRAQETITKMNLTNVSLVQSNLDYFETSFDVGMALHACGVATDLVIQTCIKNKAHFICCPCCYGGIHDCHHLTYPRSKLFKDSSLLTYRDYLTIGHSADQTHDVDNAKTAQGYVCMNVVDNDRKLQAQECGYDVYLGKLLPPTCTPKNNLLVGIYL